MKHEFKEPNVFTKDMAFGEFMRRKRRLMGLNQSDFAEVLGYTQGTISRWEVGRESPPIEDAREIIKRLGGNLQISNTQRICASGKVKTWIEKHWWQVTI